MYPNVWYRMDITRIVCPHAMKALDLFITRQYCDGETAGSLLHYQREAHRVGTEPVPEGAMLLGTPAHCIAGLPPPWRKHQGVEYLPQVIEMVAARHMEGKYRLAPRVFAAECMQVFRARGMEAQRPETVFHMVNPVSYDVFYAYAALVKGENPASQYFPIRYVLAIHEIIQLVMSSGTGEAYEARYIAHQICDAIQALSPKN